MSNSFSSYQQRWGGLFWEWDIGKLEVIMRDKIICIRDGRSSNDDDYRCLLGFPDEYTPRRGEDNTRQERTMPIASAAEVLYVSSSDHPVPFIRIEGRRACGLTAFEEANTFLGHSNQVHHAGHPTELSDCEKMRTSIQVLEIYVPSSYVRAAILSSSIRNMKPQEINSYLYYLSPKYAYKLLGSTKRDACYQELARCVVPITNC
ncbi:hypothetical protein UA08_08820 [Talaromyces atroroseus]|uniref:Uncharacterized protein n=1 Tax=Talaromyces atroroseus TaxID=1441469 RepID=A0A225AB05_TALAT|nr:hypothetical protein UA08_08820 [Talaromyces atroroseus]OKL55913.1 hypothetical protein UA08_08820 [Talaromyces atroroseus]